MHTYTQRKKILIRAVGKNLLKEIIPEYSSMNLKSLVLTLNRSMLYVRKKKEVSYLKKKTKQANKIHQNLLVLQSHLLNSLTCPVTFIRLDDFLSSCYSWQAML